MYALLIWIFYLGPSGGGPFSFQFVHPLILFSLILFTLTMFVQRSQTWFSYGDSSLLIYDLHWYCIITGDSSLLIYDPVWYYIITHDHDSSCIQYFLGTIGGATTFAEAKVKNAIGRIGIFLISIPGFFHISDFYSIPVDISGTVVGESLDCLLLSGTVVGENPDHVCLDADSSSTSFCPF